MGLFANLIIEPVLQIGDKTRFDARKSFSNAGDEITLLEIDSGDGAGYIDATANKFLDWQYEAAQTYSVKVRINSTIEIQKDIVVVDEATDKLFSSDGELVAHEPDIMNWIREGRNSYLDIHRRSQEMILAYLDEQAIWDVNRNRLTKANITDIEEVNEWSKYQTLLLIFEGLSNSIDDIFFQKADRYRFLRDSARQRAVLRLDRDNDGETDINKVNIMTARLYRR